MSGNPVIPSAASDLKTRSFPTPVDAIRRLRSLVAPLLGMTDSVGGAALLEALVALAVLGTIGSSAGWLASEAVRSVARTYAEESAVRGASRFLQAVSLWTRDDLDRHLGTSQQGAWNLRVDRPSRTLYVVSLTERTSDHYLVGTALYRLDPDREAP